MVFTMAELHHELQALGYGALPDEVIVSSLSQLQLDMPQARDTIEKGEQGGGSSCHQACAPGKSAQQKQRSNVLGDGEFAAAPKKSTICNEKGLRSTNVKNGKHGYSPDFAMELDEMRKMLRVMQGAREELTGSVSAIHKHIGLEEEHELYVGNLLEQWRIMGQAIHNRRQQCGVKDMRALPSNINIGVVASNSKTEKLEQLNTSSHNSNNNNRRGKNQHDTFLEGKTQPPTDKEPSISSRGLRPGDDKIDGQAMGSNVYSEATCSVGMVDNDRHHSQVYDHEREVVFSRCITPPEFCGRDSNASESGRGLLEGNNTSLGFMKKISSSSIAPRVSYESGGMLCMDTLSLDPHNNQENCLNMKEGVPSQSCQGMESKDSPLSCSSMQAPKKVLDKLSALSHDQFLAALKKSVYDLDPQVKTNKSISNIVGSPKAAHVSCDHPNEPHIVKSDYPSNLGNFLVHTRTQNPRSLDGAVQSPLNDCNNTGIVEEEGPNELLHPCGEFKKKIELNPPVALKYNCAVTLKQSQSSRGASLPDEIGEDTKTKHVSNIVHENSGVQVDSHLLSKNTASLLSIPICKSKRAFHHSWLEKSINSIVTAKKNKGIVGASNLEISSLNSSPIKDQEQLVSPHSHLPWVQECPCIVNGYSEHRLGSHCGVGQPTLQRSGSNSPSTTTFESKSTSGKSSAEIVLGEVEASPWLKHQVVRKEAWSPAKHKTLPKKNSTAPPRVNYSSLLDPNKDNVNNKLKVLLKARRLASTMDSASDNSTLSNRQDPSLQSSAESSRYLGTQRATSSQSQVSKSNPGSSPYAKSLSFGSHSLTPKDMLSSPFGKSSSFNSFSLRSATPKDALTPGGPRRGGKVDRVARFAEMQNLWKNDKFLKTNTKRKPESFHRIFARLHLSHERCTAAYRERVLEDIRPTTEQPPFVVPTLYNNSEGVCTF